jgi:hypothetical protein
MFPSACKLYCVSCRCFRPHVSAYMAIFKCIVHFYFHMPEGICFAGFFFFSYGHTVRFHLCFSVLFSFANFVVCCCLCKQFCALLGTLCSLKWPVTMDAWTQPREMSPLFEATGNRGIESTSPPGYQSANTLVSAALTRGWWPISAQNTANDYWHKMAHVNLRGQYGPSS